MDGLTFIAPDWPAPAGVRAVATGRGGGVSGGPYTSLNLGDHVGDDPARVAANRARLGQAAGLPAEPLWLHQVHGTAVVTAGPGLHRPTADGAVAGPGSRDLVLAILTADCLPVLFTDDQGDHIGAAHAGWRGLAAGILESTVAALGDLGVPAGRLMAWLGPAIGPRAYEVGDEVRQAFLAADPAAGAHFAATRPGHWQLDLYGAARQRLARTGVTRVYGGDFCTLGDPDRFFSHRRDGGSRGSCGRQATLIWRTRAG